MKILKRILLVLGALIGLVVLTLNSILLIDARNTSYLSVSSQPDFENNSYFIKNVHVIPMTGDTTIMNTIVQIVDGKIESIGVNQNSKDLPVIDAGGGFLSPGLTDMHVHVWDEYELGLYLANGVTAVRNLWGRPLHLRMKEALRNDEILGPMFFTSGPKLTGPVFIGDDNLQLFSVEQAKELVIAYKERGYDFIKTYYGLTEELFDAIIDQSVISGMEIAAHATPEVPYAYHFHPQIKSIEHVEDIVQLPLEYQLDTTRLNEVVDLYAANPRTSFCPTTVVYYNIYRLLTEENILQSESLDYMNPLIRKVDSKAQYDRWTQTRLNDASIIENIKNQHNFHLLAIRKLHERGVNIVAGTDSGIGVTLPGYSIHEELDFYRQAGMSPYEALKTATINPSKTHDFLSTMGTIMPGKFANLNLTKQNPLYDLATLKNPQMVLIRGRKIGKETINLFEEKARTRSNLLASAMRYAEYLLFEK